MNYITLHSLRGLFSLLLGVVIRHSFSDFGDNFSVDICVHNVVQLDAE